MWLPISVRDGEEKSAVLKNEGLVQRLVRNVVGKKKQKNLILRGKKKNIGALVSAKDKRLTGTDVINYIVPGLAAKVKSAS